MPPDRLRSPRPSLFAASHAPSAAGRGKAVSLPVQPTRILIVGNGGREHALAWKLAAEPGVNDVFVTEGRTAMLAMPHVHGAPADAQSPTAVVARGRQAAIELVVIGPRAP